MNQYYTTDKPPMPEDPITRARWEETAKRRRMMEGLWDEDLLIRYRSHMGLERAEAHKAYEGGLDRSCNPFKSINTELAQLYHVPPSVHHPSDRDDVNDWLGDGGALASSMLWPMMEWYQAQVLACREYLIRVDVTNSDGLIFRPVSPEFIDATPYDDRPNTPRKIDEYRQRQHKGEVIWTIDRYDITDPENPVYQVIAPHRASREVITKGQRSVESYRGEEDITDDVLGGNQSGDNYKFRKLDGTPVLPWVLHHSMVTLDRLWMWSDGLETVDGSLNAAVMLTFILHAMRSASWPQKWAVNVVPIGANTAGTENTPRRAMTADPATVVLFKTAAGGMESPGQPMIGQWSAGADIAAMDAAFASYVNRIATDAGIPPGDIQRMGGTARSGYAIALSNASKRIAQDAHRTSFSAHDAELVALAATLWNRVNGTDLPEDGYNVAHKPIPLSPQEIAERRKNLLELLTAGLISRIEAYKELHPGMDDAHANARLQSIDRERFSR